MAEMETEPVETVWYNKECDVIYTITMELERTHIMIINSKLWELITEYIGGIDD